MKRRTYTLKGTSKKKYPLKLLNCPVCGTISGFWEPIGKEGQYISWLGLRPRPV